MQTSAGQRAAARSPRLAELGRRGATDEVRPRRRNKQTTALGTARTESQAAARGDPSAARGKAAVEAVRAPMELYGYAGARTE